MNEMVMILALLVTIGLLGYLAWDVKKCTWGQF